MISSFLHRVKELVIPFLFGWSFILATYASNSGELRLSQLPLPILAATLVVALIMLLSFLLLRDRQKGIIYSIYFLIFFFFYGSVYTLIPTNSSIISWVHDLNYLLISLVVLFLFIGYWWLHHASSISLRLLHFLLTVGIILNTFSIGLIALSEVPRLIGGSSQSPLDLPQVSMKKGDDKPDIYYIVPEDYSNQAVMSQYFHTDTSELVDFLQKNGFYVPTNGTSNYPKSFESIASTLNMEYLSYLSHNTHSNDQTIVNPLLNNNNVLKLVHNLGYNYYQMGSWWDPTHYNPYADDNFLFEDTYLKHVEIDPFSLLLLDNSLLKPLVEHYIPVPELTNADASRRARILYQFNTVEQVAALPGPKFVFLHVIAPHDPYVLDANCQPITYSQTKKFSEPENYGNQALCINHELEQLVTMLLSKSKIPPVIIMQSDEGAPFLGRQLKPADNWKSATTAMLQEKFPTFAAYYVPKADPKVFSPTMTPVNIFRIVFNSYFGTHLTLLTDKNYIFRDLNDLYNFTDVTKQVGLQP